MAVAEAVISFAVEKIGELILQKAEFLGGISSRVEELRTELIRMRCFLRDAESRQEDSRSIRNWVTEIRNIAYDAEDVLEIYVLDTVTRGTFSRCRLQWRNPISLHKVGSEIDDITARLATLTASLPTYGLKELKDRESPASSSETKSLRHSYSHTIEQNVVGLEEDANLLLAQLERPDCRVVSICGMGGLGKTTLAKKVYHECKVGGDFEFFIWVFVSQQWEKRNIWETLLYKLISPPKESLRNEQMDKKFNKEWKRIQKMKNDAVAKMLYDELRKKRCLVVLDDIWDNVRDALRPGFPTEETSSKFLITTRNKKMARGYIHEPRCLNDDDSWELFTRTAMPAQSINFNPAAYRIDGSMETLGREMVKHCRGLPLAIVVLGGLLSTKRTYGEWDRIHQCIKSYLKGEDFGVFQLLALSYDDLPYELKPCFLYLGVLPEDSEISQDRLINLWVAEGIIYPPRIERVGEEELEDIAYRYLTELAERYMVIVAKRDSFGRIKRCQMHDLMREFCLSKSEEENFFQVVPLYGRERSLNISSSSVMVTGRVRRLSLHLKNFPGHVDLECEKYPPFRSILGFSLDQCSRINHTLMESFIRSFKLLRILDLERVHGFYIPNTIGKLIHLRLLNLGSAWIINHPLSIGNLSCLLTLRLGRFCLARTIPNVFRKLKRLRHLYLPRISISNRKRLQFADLTDLRTLVNFPASNADVEDLIRLTNLRKLKIVISDEIALRRFKAIFEYPNVTFNYLRDFSINLGESLEIESRDLDNIKSRCPRLLRLKVDENAIYQKTPEAFRGIEED